MATILTEISTITSKGQTTVPKSVRQALDVDYGDSIAFRVDENGVSLQHAEEEKADPVIDGFLAFLARDMEADPTSIKAFPAALADRIAVLTRGMEVDIDALLHGEVDL